MAEITFESEGYELAGNIFKPHHHPKNAALLFIQGWTGTQNVEAAEALAKLGYTTMTYDMRGNGKSEGNLGDFSRADFVHDACVAYDYLLQQAGDDVTVGVVGNSFGSYISAMLTTKRPVACLSLHVPANYPDEGYEQPQLAQMTPDRLEWRKQPLDYKHNNALKIINEFKGNIQIIEDGADEVVAHQTPQNYANAIASPSRLTYEVIPDALHTLETPEQRADYCNRLTRWVSQKL